MIEDQWLYLDIHCDIYRKCAVMPGNICWCMTLPSKWSNNARINIDHFEIVQLWKSIISLIEEKTFSCRTTDAISKRISLGTFHGEPQMQRSGLLESRNVARQKTCHGKSDRAARSLREFGYGCRVENNPTPTRPRRHF